VAQGQGRSCPGQVTPSTTSRDCSDEPWALGLLLARRAVACSRLRSPETGRDHALPGGLVCPRCKGRMRLLAVVTDPKSVARYLRGLGEPTEAPTRAPARGPPY
jgi:hypothetical protein